MRNIAAALASLLRDRPDLGRIDDAHLKEVLDRDHFDRPFVTPPCGVQAPKILSGISRPHLWKARQP